MFLRHKAERVDLMPQFAGDGVDIIAELLLLFGRKRRHFADLLEVACQGIGEIVASDTVSRSSQIDLGVFCIRLRFCRSIVSHNRFVLLPRNRYCSGGHPT